MVRTRNLGLALFLAASVAGCSELRWCRFCCNLSAPAPVDETAPKKMPLAPVTAKSPPNYAPALYIPGSAEVPAKVAPVQTTPGQLTSDRPQAGAAVVTTLPPLTPADPGASDTPLQAVQRKAATKWASLEAYACRMRRREVVAGQPRPEELIEAKFRKEPYSVSLKWIGPEAKGREVIYVQGQHGNLIHTITASGDIFLVPGGSRFKVAPDSLLVRNKSRYSITEAGVGALIERFGKVVEGVERNDPRTGTLKHLGQLKRKEFEEKVEVVLQSIPAGLEPLLPAGGQRLWCFDPEHGLPVLIVTHDDTNREVEYYCHDRFEFPARYSDGVFNPDNLGKKARRAPRRNSRILISRMWDGSPEPSGRLWRAGPRSFETVNDPSQISACNPAHPPLI